MILKNIILENFRNYVQETVELNPKINLFIGENAQGKTNLIEAIYYLATGRSFRNSRELEIINWNKDYLRLQIKFFKKSVNREFFIDFYYDKKGNKQLKINGVKQKKLSNLWGLLQLVKFSPDDLNIIKAGPQERRKYFDLEICQLSPDYYHLNSQFYKILQQRNILLKEIRDKDKKDDLLEIWDEQLVKKGSMIIKKRIDFLKKLVPVAKNTHKEITSQKELLDITYNSVLIDNPDTDIEDIEKKYLLKLKEERKQEIIKGVTLTGPHRDDVLFYLNGKNLKIFGSQGQQRTAILALKIAQLKLFSYLNEEHPLLLLDDVMSELDDYRRQYLINLIQNNEIQTFITGTNLDFMKGNFDKRGIYLVENGNIKNLGRI